MMMDWSADAGVPVHILLTKADKLKRGAQQATLFTVKKNVPDSVTLQTFSSTNHLGKKDLVRQVSLWLDV
jgi:GTP-binding protein